MDSPSKDRHHRKMSHTKQRGCSPTINTVSILFYLFISCLSLTKAANVTFPPLYNAALQAQVTLDPPNAICGLNGQQMTYCESFDDHTSVDACREAGCTLKCALPHRNQLTYPIITFEKVDEKSRSASRDCISSITPGTEYYFKGTRGPNRDYSCHLDLIKDWVVNLVLFRVWSATITTWIKPNNTLPG